MFKTLSIKLNSTNGWVAQLLRGSVSGPRGFPESHTVRWGCVSAKQPGDWQVPLQSLKDPSSRSLFLRGFTKKTKEKKNQTKPSSKATRAGAILLRRRLKTRAKLADRGDAPV